ncbi:MAG: hypothetical protein M1821_005529 [Bathelium mastoideum]|nr:MAG: hypothetical protein M1821_005529 [Bathelium mastoideum]KAI9691858.1 MAG: hypothetical protein M1822_007930 [Bathelium mastoideum]
MSQSPAHPTPQSAFELSAPPPPPPPKPSAHSSGHGTPLSGPPRPPPPPGQVAQPYYDPNIEGPSLYTSQPQPEIESSETLIPLPENGWLPDSLRDKSTTDLQHLLSHPSLQTALINSPSIQHPAPPQARAHLHRLLAANRALATALDPLEAQLRHQRGATQARLLALRAQEQQYRARIAETESALRDFSPMALYQRLSAAVGEQEALCKTIVESFLDGGEGGGGGVGGEGGGGGQGGGLASERDVAEFVKRIREARKTAFLRRERKERWDEGRVGGWR